MTALVKLRIKTNDDSVSNVEHSIVQALLSQTETVTEVTDIEVERESE